MNKSHSSSSIFQYSLVTLCRLVVSATFIFSGLVKLIDPVGTQYKIEDYIIAVGLDRPSPTFALVVAVVLAMLEFCLGIYLFFGIRRRFTTYTILGFMAIYTPLTLWLAITNAVGDCGCFGDAIILTNWQTFWKNVVLLLGAIALFWRGNLIGRFISESAQWLISLYTIIYSAFLAALCIYAEPVIDFRPYHITQDMRAAMEWPEDPDQLPEIMDFMVMPVAGGDASLGVNIDTETLLADTSYTFLLVSPHLEDADDANMERINAIYDYAVAEGYAFWCLTASGENEIHRWQDLTGAEYQFAFVDELTLKTMARNNPALLLIHDGTIVGKWSHRLLPQADELTGPLHTLKLANPQPASYHRMLLRLLLWYLGPLLILTILDRLIASVRWWRKRKNEDR